MTAVTKNLEIWDIRDFGAEVDGVTDDLAAWNTAVATANDTRKILFVPPTNTPSYVSAGIDLGRCSVDGGDMNAGSGASQGSAVKFASGGFFSSVDTNSGYMLSNILIQAETFYTPGQTLVDMSGQNFPRMFNCRVDGGDIGILLAERGGIPNHYGRFFGVDIFRCITGLRIGNSSGVGLVNSHAFYGGRYWSMRSQANGGGVGVEIELTQDNIAFYGVHFEVGPGNTGIRSAGIDVFCSGCRFETLGAGVNFDILAGAKRHSTVGCNWSSGFTVNDANTPTVFFTYDRPIQGVGTGINRIGPHEVLVLEEGNPGVQHELTVDAAGRLLIDGVVVGTQT